MRGFGVYEVIGARKYRGHDPGTVFEAQLDPGVEQRAIDRRAIRLIRRVTPSVVPAHFTPPANWPTEAPQGASSM